MKINSKYKGIFYIILSAFCFAFMNAFVRLAGDIPAIQKSFFRNSVAVIFAAVILIKNHTGFHIEKGCLMPLIFRALFGTLGIICNFYAIGHLVLADASMLNKMSPFFVIIFSYIILKEKISLFQGCAVITAFVGSLFIIKPTFTNMELVPSVIGFAGGMFAGLAYCLVRMLGKKGQNGPFIVFFFSAFSCIVTLPYLIFNYHHMELDQLLSLLCAGLAASGGQFAITAAYFHSPAGEISVYDYSQIIFAALLGFIMFGQIPDVYSVIGYIIICSTAIVMFLKNKRST